MVVDGWFLLKIFLIIYIFGFAYCLWVIFHGVGLLPYAGFEQIFILAPLAGVMLIFLLPHIAIPYYIVAFSLLYWWEKRKERKKVEAKNVV
jgi:hypothetical protein